MLRRRSLVVLIAATLLAVPACSSDDAATAAPTTTEVPAVTTTTVAPTTTAAPTTTVPIPAASFPTPTAAGTALYTAWTKSDRGGAGALNLAPSAELDKLFATVPSSAAKNRGCDDGNFDAANCFFGNGQGGVNVSLVPAPGGWTISTIDPFG